MTLIHISPGHSCCVASAPDDRETRWCFKCRKHLPHAWALMDDPPERQPSYYDAVPVLRCFQCREDHTAFPGTYCDGPHYPESESVWALLVERAQATRATWDWDAIWARDKELSASFREQRLAIEDEFARELETSALAQRAKGDLMAEIINRSGRLRSDADAAINAYPPEDGEADWDFQLSFVTGHGTAVTFSGVKRDDMEALRDRINEVLALSSPSSDLTKQEG